MKCGVIPVHRQFSSSETAAFAWRKLCMLPHSHLTMLMEEKMAGSAVWHWLSLARQRDYLPLSALITDSVWGIKSRFKHNYNMRGKKNRHRLKFGTISDLRSQKHLWNIEREISSCVFLSQKRDKVFGNKSPQGENGSQTKEYLLKAPQLTHFILFFLFPTHWITITNI